jgi:hypothetical protein
MKGVASNTLVVLGHGTLGLTSSYVLTLLLHQNLLHLSKSLLSSYSHGQCKVCFAQIANILNLIFEQDKKKKLNFT